MTDANAGGRLHVIIDIRPGSDGRELTRAVLDGGAPVVQVRVKQVTDRERYELTAPIAELCANHGATCIVNDRVDIALAVKAGGVHVGGDDLPVRVACKVVGRGVLVGGTARDPVTAQRLQGEGASYLGVGPIYATSSKAGLPQPIGLEGLRAITDAVEIPVIAIAGISLDRIPGVMAEGAHGVAVIGALERADDPRRATAELVSALERGR